MLFTHFLAVHLLGPCEIDATSFTPLKRSPFHGFFLCGTVAVVEVIYQLPFELHVAVALGVARNAR